MGKEVPISNVDVWSSMRSCPVVRSDKPESMIDFSTAVQNLSATLEATELVGYDYNPLMVAKLVSKLPMRLKLQWMEYSQNIV